MAMPMGEVQAVMSQVRGVVWGGKVGWGGLVVIVVVVVVVGAGVIVVMGGGGGGAWLGDGGGGGMVHEVEIVKVGGFFSFFWYE